MSKPLPKYVCHKEVRALEIHRLEWDAESQTYRLYFNDTSYPPITVSKEWVDSKGPRAGGYYVAYADGYTSFSPAKAFEEGYTFVAE